MLNKYAANFAAAVLKGSTDGDALGREMVIQQLDLISDGSWMMVPVESSEVMTENVRRILGTVYMLLDRPDPTCEEYRGAIKGAKAYIEDTCPWIKKYI